MAFYSDCHGSRKYRISSLISDVSESSADGPSRAKKQKLNATRGYVSERSEATTKLSATGEEVVAKRDGHSDVS